MVCILEHSHQQYVPTLEQERAVQNVYSGEYMLQVHRVLLGGDQLTVARARSCQRSRGNSDSNLSKLSGVIPVVEDWHAGVTLLTVSV